MNDNILDLFNTKSFSCTANELILIIGTAILVLILVAELLDFNAPAGPTRPCSCHSESPSPPAPGTQNLDFEYGYGDFNGPSVWKCNYPDALGCRQSPVNITSKNALVCPSSPLNWSSEYTASPNSIRITNDGHCAIIHFACSGSRPAISGGPLKACYELYCIRFRWGPTDDEGSEHTIDYRRFAMEMQAIHVKSGCPCSPSATEGPNANENFQYPVAIVSYVFQITPIDNPYLEPILGKLNTIRYPETSSFLASFPICWLLHAFVSDYYMYHGSLTYPPCTEGVLWIVQPEPLAISSRQVRQFRKLISKADGSMQTNTRPIQCLNNRDIFYFTSNDL